MEKSETSDDCDDKILRVLITEKELLCKNNCGFYGTPQCSGFCSHCFRVYQQEKKYTKNRVLLCQDSFDEKRKVSDTKIKSFLLKSPSLFSSFEFTQIQPSPSASNSSFGLRLLGADNPSAQQEFLKYLNDSFASNVARDLEKTCLPFMDKLYKYWALSKENDARRDEALSDMIQSFYRLMTEKVARLKTGIQDDFKVLDFMIKLESYICDHAYSILFCSGSEEESADLNLQERIRSLHWVTFGFLETSLDFSSEKVQYFVDEAITEIVDMNSHRQVWKKLECLIHCSKCIFDALKESRSGAPASADEFLPVLIYVVLKANPPLIQSNLNFISRYALSYRIMRGESGYYFTNISCALQFIKNMNAESLHLTIEEFDDYITGKRVPPKRSSISSTTLKCIETSLKGVEEILEKRNFFIEKASDLSTKIEKDCLSFQDSVKQFLDTPSSDEIKKISKELSEDVESVDILNNISNVEFSDTFETKKNLKLIQNFLK